VQILTVKDPEEKETTDDIQGKILIHTEYTLLKVLQNHKGVVQQHGLYEVCNFKIPTLNLKWVLSSIIMR